MSYQSSDAAYIPVQTTDPAEAPALQQPAGGGSSGTREPSISSRTVGIFLVTLIVTCFLFVGTTRSGPSEAVSSNTQTTSTPIAVPSPFVDARQQNKVCQHPDYSTRTLKLAHEMPVVALLGRPEGPVFETSCILNVGDYFYVVSDDSPAIGKIRSKLQYNDPLNTLIPPSRALTEEPSTENGFEALFYDEKTDTFSAVIEAISLKGGRDEPIDARFHSVIYDLKIRPDGSAYDITGECPSNFEFSSANKGFEGAALVKNSKGDEFVLGLCEGNFCEGGARGRTFGNGRVVLLKRGSNVNIHGKIWDCAWTVVKVIELPASLDFADYSAITLYGSDPKTLRVAIASQETSQVWIGGLDADEMKFITDGERVLDFPRSDGCDIVYCNVEGLDFLSDNLLVAASDQMKNAGRQPARCLAKDQSIHVFVIP